MDKSWKNGLLCAHEMRLEKAKLVREPSAKALSLVKEILDEILRLANKNCYSYLVLSLKMFYFVPEVVSILQALGYNADYEKVKPDYRDGNSSYYKIQISW